MGCHFVRQLDVELPLAAAGWKPMVLGYSAREMMSTG